MPDTKKSSKGISPKKLSNLKVVVLCVAAATTFWILNALNKDDYTTIVDYPIEFEFDRERYIAVAPLPATIEVEINGNGWDLLRKYFNFNTTPFIVNLEQPSSRDYLIPSDLRRELSEFLSPTQIVSLSNDTLNIEVDRIRTIKMRPTLDSMSYSLGKNIRLLNEPEFEPKEVTVTGAESILEIYDGKFPVNLDERRLDRDLTKNVKLGVSKELSEFISIKEESISVHVDVVAFLEGNKRMKIKKVNFPRTVHLEDEDPTIMLYYLVDERYTEELKDLEFEAVLNYSQRNREDSTIAIQVNPRPNFLDQVRIEPAILKLSYGN
ncbi:MAG: YbbR-like domain-containing protein [Algoriphagus sp.]|uniref:YbbR-like domain-containing protein n=1 Tax=Algoriphagus sp. TaxID=1872435 RepID=UPI0018230F42|nr:YbbR-like domain-containing protein [Algoriphagus sp.]NVJ86708.1 YbbR-like domain-containing protein [Algoriphagus sp.]